jgi:hypothetical protein
VLTCVSGRYGYSTTHRAPTWVELNIRNVVIQPIAGEAEAARVLANPKSWVIMHSRFGREAPPPPHSADQQPRSSTELT